MAWHFPWEEFGTTIHPSFQRTYAFGIQTKASNTAGILTENLRQDLKCDDKVALWIIIGSIFQA